MAHDAKPPSVVAAPRLLRSCTFPLGPARVPRRNTVMIESTASLGSSVTSSAPAAMSTSPPGVKRSFEKCPECGLRGEVCPVSIGRPRGARGPRQAPRAAIPAGRKGIAGRPGQLSEPPGKLAQNSRGATGKHGVARRESFGGGSRFHAPPLRRRPPRGSSPRTRRRHRSSTGGGGRVVTKATGAVRPPRPGSAGPRAGYGWVHGPRVKRRGGRGKSPVHPSHHCLPARPRACSRKRRIRVQTDLAGEECSRTLGGMGQGRRFPDTAVRRSSVPVRTLRVRAPTPCTRAPSQSAPSAAPD
ncbi:hypothetical protein SLNWT_2351 [Streptomyces albus]|uniref:Uncharacterized protein n=1 Tax=Streptomyces albus (strain ATCC 21838 / DSM 41398 / FERM P-419 / JCM 4703 / NBRC 107858) TaxID=1081613 RepID=A0A0B5EX80_STRA4|nr:hypothetical protein SLNWT_2351 [Streptomyces albus]AOU77039.1 hypothetical protein SLNHY_2348 [Streptomyces albus]AYN32814.1 hypothetical protein DUI70_2313 [Streptomyces albus]